MAEPDPRPTSRSIWPWVRAVAGAGILALVLWRLGTGPVRDGLRHIGAGALAAALCLGAVTTVCAAWRWRLVAGGLGVPVPLGAAVAHCYRAVFLNSTLPGGVLGDVHRAVRHGRESGDTGRAVRAVVWERAAGQAVQVGIAVVLLAVFPSPVRPYLPVVGGLAVAAGLGVVLVARAPWRPGRPEPGYGEPGRSEPDRPKPGRSWSARVLGTAGADLRAGLLARRAWPGVVLASAVAVTGHLAMFLVAARTAGATAPLLHLVPLLLLALLAMAVPANVAGFGPREGVAAWAFGAAGLTGAQGVATAVTYGVLALVASLPGAVVLVRRRVRTRAIAPYWG